MEAYRLSKILASTKMGGPRMLKGQLSRAPWPGNSRMLFTFQLALCVLQQPHKNSHSLQLAIYSHGTKTHKSLHSIYWYMLYEPFPCVCVCFSSRVFLQSTTQPHQRPRITLERATSHIKVTCPPCLFQLLP